MGRRRRSLLGSPKSPAVPKATDLEESADVAPSSDEEETVDLDDLEDDPAAEHEEPGDDGLALDLESPVDVELDDDETVPRVFEEGGPNPPVGDDMVAEVTEPVQGGFGTAAEFDDSSYEAPTDAPFASELFVDSGYDELPDEPPPTEEVPSGVMEDISQPYNAPYSVPEPPPIPGILDRFTPPPAQRTEMGSRKKSNKPDYLDDTPGQSPDRIAALPSAGGGLVETGAPRGSALDDDDDDDERRGPPVGLMMAVGGGGLAVVGLGAIVVLVMMLLNGGGGDSEGVVPTRDPVDQGVEVRDNMTQEPALIGAPDPDEAPTEGGTDAEVDPDGAERTEDDPDEGTEGDADEATPAPAPQPQPRAQPRPQPRPDPKPEAAARGTLKIRSNRRVLVYVNGQAIGYTPQDYKVNPGDYSISAMVPGQPNTKQTRDASISDAGTTTPVDFTF
jgi:hypothetical protein